MCCPHARPERIVRINLKKQNYNFLYKNVDWKPEQVQRKNIFHNFQIFLSPISVLAHSIRPVFFEKLLLTNINKCQLTGIRFPCPMMQSGTHSSSDCSENRKLLYMYQVCDKLLQPYSYGLISSQIINAIHGVKYSWWHNWQWIGMATSLNWWKKGIISASDYCFKLVFC